SWPPVEFLHCRLDVAPRCAHVTVAELRPDGRFGSIADDRDFPRQLMDGRRDPRPDVQAAWLSCRSLYRGEQRRDDIFDENEIAQDPSVFVDVQRHLLTRQSREK